MKKIIVLLLSIMVLAPICVMADLAPINTFVNRNTVVDGEVELYISTVFDQDTELEIAYDETMLKVDESMVSINHPTTVKLVNGGPNTVNNKLDVKVESGKIIIKTKMDRPEGVAGDIEDPYINVRFIAIKAGTTDIKISSKNNSLIKQPSTITIKEKSCGNNDSNEEITTTGEETVAKKEDTSKNDGKNIVFYISLGINVLLFIALIVSIVTRKKPKVETKN